MEAHFPFNPSSEQTEHYLRSHGVAPTAQRVRIARVLFAKPAHFSADQVHRAVNALEPAVSKATVYNTLGLFVDRGLIREVVVDPSKVFYDSNTGPHHHLYDVDSGELADIEADRVTIEGLPELPPDVAIQGIDVVVRVRKI